MTGAEGFRFADDPLADPVFRTSPQEPGDGPAAVCRDVVKTYRTATESVTALDGVTLSIPRAQVTVVVGPSGSGKSSLLRLLACVDRPDSGGVRIAGRRGGPPRPRGGGDRRPGGGRAARAAPPGAAPPSGGLPVPEAGREPAALPRR